jgi:hypothetical protein
VLEAFFEALMALVVIGTIAFAGLVFSKLYQGQR